MASGRFTRWVAPPLLLAGFILPVAGILGREFFLHVVGAAFTGRYCRETPAGVCCFCGGAHYLPGYTLNLRPACGIARNLLHRRISCRCRIRRAHAADITGGAVSLPCLPAMYRVRRFEA